METELQVIYNICCEVSGFDLSSKTRQRDVTYARMVYFYFARDRTNASLSKIGKLANRDHATVLHGVRKYKELIMYPEFKSLSDKIKRHIPRTHEEGLSYVERELKMLYSNKNRMEREVFILKRKLSSTGVDFLEDIKELPQEQLEEFRDLKWIPHKKMLESRKNYPKYTRFQR